MTFRRPSPVRIGAVAALLLLLAGAIRDTATVQDDHMSPVRGQWLTEGAKALVEIKSCENDTSRLCGRIIWTWKRSGNVGKQILRDFEWAGDQLWKGGQLLDPKGEKSYRGRLELTQPDRLEVRGCLLLFCRTQTWLRPSSLIDAMPHD